MSGIVLSTIKDEEILKKKENMYFKKQNEITLCNIGLQFAIKDCKLILTLRFTSSLLKDAQYSIYCINVLTLLTGT